MRAILFSLLLFPIFSFSQQGDWQVIFDHPGAKIYDMDFINRDTGVIIYKIETYVQPYHFEGNFVLHTTNGGISWDTIQRPHGTYSLYDAHYSNDSLVYVGGHDGVFYKSTDGLNFTGPSIRMPWLGHDLGVIHCISEGVCLLFDLNGKVFYTPDSGEYINEILDFNKLLDQDYHGYNDFFGMDFNRNGKGIIYNSNQCEGFVVSFDWATQTQDTLFQGQGEVIPAMTPNENHYVLGYPHWQCEIADSIAPYLTYSYNDGLSWSVPIDVPMEGRPRSLRFVDEQTGFLAEGNYLTHYFRRDDEFGRIRKTQDGGQTWTTEFESEVGIRKLQMFAEDYGYAISRLGKVYKLDGYLPPIDTTPALPLVEYPDLGDEPIYVYPNPASDVLNIQFQDEAYKKIFLINSRGQILREKDSNERLVEIDIRTLNDGLYLLQVAGIPGQRIAKRVLILRN